MLVVDASAVAELLLGRPLASAIEAHVVEHAADLHAPHLLDVEVLSVLRRLVGAAEADAARAGAALEDLLDLPVERYPHHLLARRAWELRGNFSPYDAVYVALAEGLAGGGASLLTADGRLARAARKHADAPVIAVA